MIFATPAISRASALPDAARKSTRRGLGSRPASEPGRESGEVNFQEGLTKGPHKRTFGTKASAVYHRVHTLSMASFLRYPMVFERLRPNSRVRTERPSL